MAQDSDWKKGELLDEFNSLAAKAAAFAANNPQLQGKANFGPNEKRDPTKPKTPTYFDDPTGGATGDPNKPSTWTVQETGPGKDDFTKDRQAHQAMVRTAKKPGSP